MNLTKDQLIVADLLQKGPATWKDIADKLYAPSPIISVHGMEMRKKNVQVMIRRMRLRGANVPFRDGTYVWEK